jgi:hypothetical protein
VDVERRRFDFDVADLVRLDQVANRHNRFSHVSLVRVFRVLRGLASASAAATRSASRTAAAALRHQRIVGVAVRALVQHVGRKEGDDDALAALRVLAALLVLRVLTSRRVLACRQIGRA